MMKQLFLPLALLSLALFSALPANAAPDLESAEETYKTAIEVMDEGNYDLAIVMLEGLSEMYPDNYNVTYELALALMLDKQYDRAEKIAISLLNKRDTNDRSFSLLGSIYDYQGEPQKALDTYSRGLLRFPESGKLYVETGITYIRTGDKYKALKAFDKSIEVDPQYDPAYFHAANIYALSNVPLYAMLYAETYTDIAERKDRKAEMRSLYLDILKEKITVSGDTINIRLVDNSVCKPGSLFSVYELGLLLGCDKVRNGWTLDALSRMRLQALNATLEVFDGRDVGSLLDYQRRVRDAGHWDAYNIYLLGPLFSEEANAWLDDPANAEAFQAYAEWDSENPILLDADHHVIPPFALKAAE